MEGARKVAGAWRTTAAGGGSTLPLAAAEVGGVVLVIDAKHEWVARWYASYGAVPLLDAPFTLMLPLATVRGRT
ncbi:MAG: hypothetical protein WAL56_12360 [Candidatus Sulfotelmatobacter sp.]